MSYSVTFYTRAVTPIQEFFATKGAANAAMTAAVKEEAANYPKKSGYRKAGSIAAGRVTFEHPYYGVDFVARLEKN